MHEEFWVGGSSKWVRSGSEEDSLSSASRRRMAASAWLEEIEPKLDWLCDAILE